MYHPFLAEFKRNFDDLNTSLFSHRDAAINLPEFTYQFNIKITLRFYYSQNRVAVTDY